MGTAAWAERQHSLQPGMHNAKGADTRTGVYKIYFNGSSRFYIGSATGKRGFAARWNSHLCDLRKGRHGNEPLQRAWAKYGEQSIRFEVLLVASPRDCQAHEQAFLNELWSSRLLYNAYPIAGSPERTCWSEERRRRHSERMRGEGNPNYGKPRSEEDRRKTREAQLGRPRGPHSPDHCRRISESLRRHYAQRPQ